MKSDTSLAKSVLPNAAADAKRAPVQKRSRESRIRILAAAEKVIVSRGLSNFSIQAIAETGNVSIGQIYRRFNGRNDILTALKRDWVEYLQDSFARELSGPLPSLRHAIAAYTKVITDAFAERGNVYAEIIPAQDSELSEEGRQSVLASREQFLRACTPHAAEIQHQDPYRALEFTWTVITGTLIYRASHAPFEDRSWDEYGSELCSMAVAQLTGRAAPARN